MNDEVIVQLRKIVTGEELDYAAATDAELDAWEKALQTISSLTGAEYEALIAAVFA